MDKKNLIDPKYLSKANEVKTSAVNWDSIEDWALKDNIKRQVEKLRAMDERANRLKGKGPL